MTRAWRRAVSLSSRTTGDVMHHATLRRLYLTRHVAVVVAAVAALATVTPPTFAQATGAIAVGVAERGTGTPIADAEVRLAALGRVARTNWLGEARFDDVPPGTQRVGVRRLGYAPASVEVRVGDTPAGPVFLLDRVPAILDTVAIRVARRRATDVNYTRYEWRRQMGIGRFIADSIFVAERHKELGTVLSTRLPGLVVNRDLTNHLTFGSNSCGAVDVYVDDVLVYPDPSTRNALARLRSRESDFPPLSPIDLAGAEFYKGYSAPPQYRPRGRGCAVLLLWTRKYGM